MVKSYKGRMMKVCNSFGNVLSGIDKDEEVLFCKSKVKGRVMFISVKNGKVYHGVVDSKVAKEYFGEYEEVDRDIRSEWKRLFEEDGLKDLYKGRMKRGGRV